MTEMERRRQQEIERLQNKLRRLSEAYDDTREELDRQKEQKRQPRKKGRPPVDAGLKARVLALCCQGCTMREIAERLSLSLGAVHKIIAKATEDTRILYIYRNHDRPATLIDACPAIQRVKIVNFTDDMLDWAFGVREKPGWDDFMEFLEDRCMPRTRYGIREELACMGIDAYDPFLIVEKTKGRVYGDHQWLERKDREWIRDYEKVLKETKPGPEQTDRLLGLLEMPQRGG